MSLRGINGTYQLTEGTLLPGFTPSPKYFGMDEGWNAPGWGFIFGSQSPNIRHTAAQKGWLTQNESLTMPFTQRMDESINLRATIEPSPDLKIQVDVKKETMSSYQEIYRFDSDGIDDVSRKGSSQL